MTLDQLVNNLSTFITSTKNEPQVKYCSNFQRFQYAVANLVSQLRGPLTLGDVFEALEDAGAFCLKVMLNLHGEQVKVDYNLTLSCYSITMHSGQQEMASLQPEGT